MDGRTMGRSSRISGFYNLTPAERRHILADWAAAPTAAMTPEQAASLAELLATPGGLTLEQADKMVENVVGTYALPLGIATNFVVNGRDVLVPMVIEEPSVVAGASFAARLARAGGGFHAETTEPLMIGQIQVLDLADVTAAGAKVLAQKQKLIDLANSTDPIVVSLHGGARDVEVRVLPESPAGPMLIVHLIYDCRDAMAPIWSTPHARRWRRWFRSSRAAGSTCASSRIWPIGGWRGHAASSRPPR